MASRKRWDTIYDKANPFALPQNIAKEVKSVAHDRRNGRSKERMKYLWVYVTPVQTDSVEGIPAQTVSLATDEWLSIVDESASLGTECLIISTGEGLDKHPEILAMASWAQETHEMLVGLHLYNQPLSPSELEKLKALDQRLFALFVDSEILDEMPLDNEEDIRAYKADCDGREFTKDDCIIPKNMSCIGPNGKMYACGYVYGDKKYAMGHCFDKELDAVMRDESIPRTIPRGDTTKRRRCNGCPPLMQRMLEESIKREPVSKSRGHAKR
ncbi:MAG: SPASM domain-containing protein [Candidatus Hydrogenedentota bacterium]